MGTKVIGHRESWGKVRIGTLEHTLRRWMTQNIGELNKALLHPRCTVEYVASRAGPPGKARTHGIHTIAVPVALGGTRGISKTKIRRTNTDARVGIACSTFRTGDWNLALVSRVTLVTYTGASRTNTTTGAILRNTSIARVAIFAFAFARRRIAQIPLGLIAIGDGGAIVAIETWSANTTGSVAGLCRSTCPCFT